MRARLESRKRTPALFLGWRERKKGKRDRREGLLVAKDESIERGGKFQPSK